MFSIDRIGIVLLLSAFFVELIFALLRQKRAMFKDMLVNFCLGMGNLFAGLFMKGIALSVYSVVYEYSLFKPELSLSLWLAGFISCDFILYIYHRLGHTTRFFWAAHVAHHSSLHYNLSTGMRVNFIHMSYRFLFWSPLCLFGIPPWMILFFETLTAIHNFIIHTESVGKLGVLDLIFNTPSNHRVHHASNPEYIDKNMGGILIVFDRLFGTYMPEKNKPIYGITNNIKSNHPLNIISHEYASLIKNLRLKRGILPKLKYLFSSPSE